MADDTNITSADWLRLAPNLEHFDPFEGLSDGLSAEELRNIRHGFRIAGQNVLINRNIICEVVTNAYIYPIPNLPVWLMGLINLRGNLIPVIDLNNLLFPDNTAGRNTLLVIDRGEKAIATFIDELPVSLELDEAEAEKVSPNDKAAELIREFTREAYLIDGTIWHEIDHNGLFLKITRPFNPNETGNTTDVDDIS